MQITNFQTNYSTQFKGILYYSDLKTGKYLLKTISPKQDSVVLNICKQIKSELKDESSIDVNIFSGSVNYNDLLECLNQISKQFKIDISKPIENTVADINYISGKYNPVATHLYAQGQFNLVHIFSC